MAIADGTALYRIWGDSDQLLYIGVSDRFGTRWKEHAKKQPWWDEMRRLSVDEWFEDRDDAEEAEQAAIKTEFPKYNVTHARSGRRACARRPFVSVMLPGETREAAQIVMPHLLQTYAYAEIREMAWAELRGLAAESGRSLAAGRMRQQAALYDTRQRFDFILTEATLRQRVAPRSVMLGQFDRLLSLMELENVTIRIVPFGVQAPPVYPFIVTDGPVLRVRMDFGDRIEYGHEAEVAARHYDAIAARAVVGQDARQLISAAISDLRGAGEE